MLSTQEVPYFGLVLMLVMVLCWCMSTLIDTLVATKKKWKCRKWKMLQTFWYQIHIFLYVYVTRSVLIFSNIFAEFQKIGSCFLWWQLDWLHSSSHTSIFVARWATYVGKTYNSYSIDNHSIISVLQHVTQIKIIKLVWIILLQ